jgi:hypothetical protein
LLLTQFCDKIVHVRILKVAIADRDTHLNIFSEEKDTFSSAVSKDVRWRALPGDGITINC